MILVSQNCGAQYGWFFTTANNGAVSFEEPEYFFAASSGEAPVIVIRTGSPAAASVDYDTEDGTATAPDDYTAASDTLTYLLDDEDPRTLELEFVPYGPVTERETDILYDWIEGMTDPRNSDNDHDFGFVRSGWTWSDTYEQAVADAEATLGYTFPSTVPLGWHVVDFEVQSRVAPYIDDVEAEDVVHLALHISRYSNLLTGTVYDDFPGTVPGNICAAMGQGGIEPGDAPFYWTSQFADGTYSGSDGGIPGVWMFSEVTGAGPTYNPPIPVGGTTLNNCTGYPEEFGYFPAAWGIRDIQILAKRVPVGPPIPGIEFPDWERDPDNYTQDPDTGTVYSKEPWVKVFGDYKWLGKYVEDTLGQLVVIRPQGPVLPVGHADDTEAFWTAARNAAVLAGTLPSSVNTFDAQGDGDNTTYPRVMGYAWERTFTEAKFFDVVLSNGVNTLISPHATTRVYTS